MWVRRASMANRICYTIFFFFVNAVQPYGEGGATKDSHTGTA